MTEIEKQYENEQKDLGTTEESGREPTKARKLIRDIYRLDKRVFEKQQELKELEDEIKTVRSELKVLQKKTGSADIHISGNR